MAGFTAAVAFEDFGVEPPEVADFLTLRPISGRIRTDPGRNASVMRKVQDSVTTMRRMKAELIILLRR